MVDDAFFRPVYRVINKPLTWFGVDRRMLIFAIMLGAISFQLLRSLLAGVLIFLLFFVLGRFVTARDPELIRALQIASRWRSRYDPLKYAPPRLFLDHHS
ncbi:MAG: VirB3 family type IV secretion system protein [Vicinamibacteraceae bacterium]